MARVCSPSSFPWGWLFKKWIYCHNHAIKFWQLNDVGYDNRSLAAIKVVNDIGVEKDEYFEFSFVLHLGVSLLKHYKLNFFSTLCVF
jgi:hypothetical protein